MSANNKDTEVEEFELKSEKVVARYTFAAEAVNRTYSGPCEDLH